MKAAIVDRPLPLAPGLLVVAALNSPDDLIHACPRCGKHAEIRFGDRGNEHQIKSRDPLTISGSIICPNGCRAHYFVTNGEIVMAGDA